MAKSVRSKFYTDADPSLDTEASSNADTIAPVRTGLNETPVKAEKSTNAEPSPIVRRTRKAFLALASFLNSAIGATFGVVLLPLARLLSLFYSTLKFSLIAAVAIPFLAVAGGWTFGSGFFGSLSLGIMVGGAIAGVVLGVFPVLFVRAVLRTLFITPLEGFNLGMNQGILALFRQTYIEIFVGENTAAQPAEAGVHRWLPSDLFRINGVDYNALLARLGAFATAAAGPSTMPTDAMAEERFNGRELATSEIAALKSDRLPPLSPAEIHQLETLSDSDVGAKLNAYKNQLRLATEPCCILLARPEREDTILLVKQYQKDGKWLPVPGFSHIFDKSSLRTHFEAGENVAHPINRDVIQRPSLYKIGDEDYETRYVFHNYYVVGERDDQPGLSQEVNLLTRDLRARLSPAPHVDENDEERRDNRMSA